MHRRSAMLFAVANPRDLKRSQLFSEELGIDLRSKKDSETFKWFLASVLFGGRISQTVAKRTYRTFERYNLLSPRRILNAGWDFLVNPIMREGGYVRYDGRKSAQILLDCESLLKSYQGRFSRLHELSADSRDLEARLEEFFGVGPVTANIFLRELRPFWKKSNPEPLPIVLERARLHGIRIENIPRNSMTFARIEAGLIRMKKRRPEIRARRIAA